MCGSHDDYFYQNEFLQMYFSKIMQTFYDLLFTGSNSEWLPSLSRISLVKFLKKETTKIPQKISVKGSVRISALSFTDDKVLYWCFAKDRSYFPNSRLASLKWHLLAAACDSYY